MANHRTARGDAKPSLTTLVALAALALGLPGGNVLADKQSSSPGVAEIASAIERGIVTVNDLLRYFPRKYSDAMTVRGEGEELDLEEGETRLPI